MHYFVGAFLALGVGAFATVVGFDRERGFYPIVMIVIAFLYALFAILDGGHLLVAELLIALPFVGLAVAGFRTSLWLVVAALVSHGVMDIGHPHFVQNGGAPPWWPTFCATYDIVAGAYLAFRLSNAKAAPVA